MPIHRALTGTTSSNIKSHNRRAILLTLLRETAVSRVGLAQATQLSTTTITNLATELLEQGVVAEDDGGHMPDVRRGVGRPQTALRIVPDARYAIGIHFNVDSLNVAISNLLAQPVQMLSRAIQPETSAKETLQIASELLETALQATQLDPALIVGLGVGVSGLVNPETGVNLIAPNQNWHHVPVKQWFMSRFPFPVKVENAVRAMALGEKMFGVGKDAASLAFVYSHYGVGAGLVIGDDIYRGSAAGAGEIGHTIIIPEGGARCRCGNTGCLETLVSEPAVMRSMRETSPEGLMSIEQIFEAARAGNPSVLSRLDSCARYMGIALANLVNVLNPELIVMGGLFALGQDVLLPKVETTLRACAFAHLGEQIKLRSTEFGQTSGVVGAAAVALDTFFFREPGRHELSL